MTRSAERDRLYSSREERALWRFWGPYLSNRAWGTVREDYSADGDAWKYFPFAIAHQKAFRWGEDGIAGFSDRYQRLCFSLAFWNGVDPILKERFFGLSHAEGNHGEDVKEAYFFTDATPTHSYQRMLYKYPHRRFPYEELVLGNLGRHGPELELLDTGIFDDDRYFDIEIEIAKATWDDIRIRITAHNRGPEPARLHLIPQLWFRNLWSWGPEPPSPPRLWQSAERTIVADDSNSRSLENLVDCPRLGKHLLTIAEPAELLFADNETHARAVYGPHAKQFSEHPKDAIQRYLVDGEHTAVRQAAWGTKAAMHTMKEIGAGESFSVHLQLAPHELAVVGELASEVARIVELRRREADEFYESVHPARATAEMRAVQRQAFAGLLWSKQNYFFDVDVWLEGDHPEWPPPASRKSGRNIHWQHLNSMRILSMPDSWEYPWFAAWDLAFHAVTFALIDAEFAKEQLWLMLFEQFQHPNGQIPAYEWEFSDLNPPVHAWAVWRVYNMDRIRNGEGDRPFLERCFHKLLLNFTWWVNKVDREGNNIFEGGFLGLDNIAFFDRSDPFPGGAVLEQSDATGWMGQYSLVMMRIALELARENPVYEGLATKFFEHYAYIAAAMKMDRRGATLWDDSDGFFYDILRFPDGTSVPFRVRSLVGLIPLYAIERLEEKWIEPFPSFRANLEWFLEFRRDVVERSVSTVDTGSGTTHVLSVVNREQLRRLLGRVVDPSEFFSPFGLRSLSRYHETMPFVFGDARVGYEPAEAESRIKGGNSNWRGPVWFPTSFLMIESLRKLEKGFGECVIEVEEDGERKLLSLSGVGRALAGRMIDLFLPDADGYRPIYGPRGTMKSERFARDPHWRDLILFHEYFNAETGEGLGAEHQTGWTALVANLIDEWS
jgi:hypothetical protein